MRIAHLADTHLGFRRYARTNARGRNQREVDVALAFDRAIDGIIAEIPDLVIVAGDLFEQVRPSNSAILAAYSGFLRLRHALPDVPVVLIAGNHDTPRSSESSSILGLFHSIGVQIAHETARRLAFPALDASVLAVPHAALFTSPRPALEPAGTERHQVLVLHGETPGLFGADRSMEEAGGALLTDADLTGGRWSYIALGHYHVQHKVREQVWYSGSLDYVSPNPWGELVVEAQERIVGKGWLLVDLEQGTVSRRPIEAPRRVLDLPRLDATDLSASELDRLLAEAVEAVPGGIGDAVVRQVVLNVPRSIARELDHATLREWKGKALHFQLDLRRPEAARRTVATGAPARRRTLVEEVDAFLQSRPLPANVEREPFVRDGLAFLADAQAASEG